MDVGVPFQDMGMFRQHVGVPFQDVGVPFNGKGVPFQGMGMPFQSVGFSSFRVWECFARMKDNEQKLHVCMGNEMMSLIQKQT